jgi:hypothetical protein
MAEFLSPGVKVTEIDASTIAPTVSNSIGVFSGNFKKGPVGSYLLITTVDELIDNYGLPDNENYNDWYQAYNFLQYGNKLYVARAANVGGTHTASGALISSDSAPINDHAIDVTDSTLFAVGDLISISNASSGLLSDNPEGKTIFQILSIDGGAHTLTLDRQRPVHATNDIVNKVIVSSNGVAEAIHVGGTELANSYDYWDSYVAIGNADDFENLESSITFSNADGKLKFIARNPGSWAGDVEIAIAKPGAFGITANPSAAFPGISLDDLFEYTPTGTEVGVVIRVGGVIEEVYRVDFDQNAKDQNGKSAYIEDVINAQSSFVFVKENSLNTNEVANYLAFDGSDTAHITALAGDPDFVGPIVELVLGMDSAIQGDDLADAYDLWANKEEVDIDIVIANELDNGDSAKNLAETRLDCIAFLGAKYSDCVGQKAASAVSNLVTWRKTGDANFNSMWVVACGNYKYQYDRYNDKNRWVNVAGDIAGLRAQTSTNRASWWASAGLERGQLKNVKKLAFNPNQGQRDILYKNQINPIVSFPGQGTVMWGQKNMLDKPSSFDRVNVRGLFNTLERSLSKMAKYQVMEFNDNFTRNRIVSMIKPFLSSVQAGRGIQDFLVICDESNNTADVISRNELVVDIYIKPTYVAEFIHLKFTNAGTNSFAEVIGGA